MSRGNVAKVETDAHYGIEPALRSFISYFEQTGIGDAQHQEDSLDDYDNQERYCVRRGRAAKTPQEKADALTAFVEYYEEAGIGEAKEPENEDDISECGGGYIDGDECFNVRQARAALDDWNKALGNPAAVYVWDIPPTSDETGGAKNEVGSL